MPRFYVWGALDKDYLIDAPDAETAERAVRQDIIDNFPSNLCVTADGVLTEDERQREPDFVVGGSDA